MSLRSSLLTEIKQKHKLSRDNLREFARMEGYDYATCDRELRKLTHDKYIIPCFSDNGFITDYMIEKRDTLEDVLKNWKPKFGDENILKLIKKYKMEPDKNKKFILEQIKMLIK